MARHWFRGAAAWAFTDVDGVDGEDNLAQLQSGVTVTVWSAETGGVQYTDLLDESGSPVTQLTTANGTGRPVGRIPPFQGPDEVWEVWVSAAGGPRELLAATDTGTVLGPQTAAIGAGLASHVADLNGHGTGLANLSDTAVGTEEARTAGHLVGWNGTQFALLAPSQVAGAVLLDPPDVAGVYVGNVATAPDPAQGSSGEPWLKLQQPHSAADTNPDAIQLFSTASGGASIKTSWFNGNNEARHAPSTPSRVSHRVFEAYESHGGPSTGRFAEWSTNPTNPGNREPLLGGYGTGHATQPGWVVATRVLAGLLGVRAGGSYNGLTAINWRGQRGSAGPPTADPWVAGDVVLDSAGAVWLCTVGGTPGTWVGLTAPTAFSAVTPGTNMAAGSKVAASRLDRGGDNGRLRGILAATGTVNAGDVIGTIAATAHRPLATVTSIARYSGGGTRINIATNGQITIGNGLTNGDLVWLDSLTWDMTA